jgi:hypothetical protein
MDPRVDGIYRLVRGRINFDTIVPTCIEVAREIEQIEGMKGKEKLSLLQDVLRTHVRHSRISISEKEQLLFVIDTVVPVVVQAAIFASKNPIVKQIQASCVGCWTKK